MDILSPSLLPLASIEDVIGICGVFLVATIVPIVSILTRHQRRMAELMRMTPQQDTRVVEHLDHMQRQIDELRSLVQEHIINNDRPLPLTQPPPTPTIEQRLNG